MFVAPIFRPAWLSYGAAVLSVLLAVIIRAVFMAELGTRMTLVTFYPAVMLTALYGGFRAGLLATALSTFAATFWMEPVGLPAVTDYADWMGMAIFFGSCAVISYITEVMTHLRVRAAKAEAQLEIMAERERGAANLRKNEEHFQTLADNIAHLAWMADENGRTFWYNKRWFDYTGTTLEEMEGWGWKRVHHPDHVDRVVARIQKAWDTGEPWEDTFPLRGKDGQYRWFLSRALPIRDERGNIVRWFGTNTDITEQLKTQEALRESEEKFRMALDAAQMGTWDWDILAGKLVWSDRCRSLCGLKPDETVSYNRFLEAVHPDDRERIRNAIADALENGKDFEQEERVVWPDGSIHWILSKGRVYHDESGNPVRMSGTAFDITRRKQLESKLQRAKKEWELTFDSVPDMIAIIDSQYRLVRVNRAMARRLGVRPEEIIGSTCYRVMHRSNVPPDFCPHTRLLQDGEEHVVEFHEENLGGHFLLSMTPLHNEQGQLLGSVHVARDITERKRMEEALERRLLALTRPLDSTEGIVFEDLFNLEEIQELQDRFAEACGVASIITRTDGTPITKPSNFCRLCKDIIRRTEKGRANCHCSDAVIGRHNSAGPNVQPCLSGGLWDAGASITVGGRHIANWLVGQVRNEAQQESQMRLYAREIGVDEEELVSAFREVPSMPRDRFEMIARMLFTLAGELSSMAYQNVQQARFITERQLMEEELRRARDELEFRVRERTAELEEANRRLSDQAALLELAHDAIIMRDTDDSITFWNNGARETYGYTKEEALGKITHKLLQTKFPVPPAKLMDRLMQQESWEGELEHITSSGKKIEIESRWALKRDADGKPAGVLEINRDVTDRKRAVEALKSYIARMELINRELQEFAFVAAHDLQEPLRKVLTFGSILKRRSAARLDESGKDYLDRMLNSVTRMRTLLDNLLQYSRVASIPGLFKEKDLGMIVRDVVRSLRQRLEETGAKVEISEDMPKMDIDEDQMRQLFKNLIENALKFRSDESPLIKVYAHCNGDGACEILVEDNGIGFEQRFVDRIFKPFQKLHREYEGIGMGLAICRKIMERHGGGIRAESKPGKGSRFIISLPRKQEDWRNAA